KAITGNQYQYMMRQVSKKVGAQMNLVIRRIISFKCDYGYLRRLPIDKLLELLALAPALSDKPEDEAYMDALEEAIIEKENEKPTGFFPDVDQQWEQFVTYYLPGQKDAALEHECTEHAVCAQIGPKSLIVPQKRIVRFKQVWRTALAATIAIACMFAAMVTAQAVGVDVFGVMARWTQGVFSFGQVSPDSQVSDGPTQKTARAETEFGATTRFVSLQEALDAYGITTVHEATRLPDGYTLGELDVTNQSEPFFVAFSAIYVNGVDGISFTIMSYDEEPATQVEKNDVSVEVIESNGITFYLIENTSSYIVAWYDEQYEYYVSGNLNKEVLWETAISMYS
ncbi:DUF4367 domain-containing protein, partial [Acutalibacter muris]|uniref:DUF4367 domain-containing protein n=1 Tax=Acutalibacter muris TaxID=1796620 RepID=UPI00272E77AB